eukprot:366519-Chlamydomonas_euryale.AAC.4
MAVRVTGSGVYPLTGTPVERSVPTHGYTCVKLSQQFSAEGRQEACTVPSQSRRYFKRSCATPCYLSTANQEVSVRHGAANAVSRHEDRGRPWVTLNPTSPSANNNCLTADPGGILYTCPRRISHTAWARV